MILTGYQDDTDYIYLCYTALFMYLLFLEILYIKIVRFDIICQGVNMGGINKKDIIKNNDKIQRLRQKLLDEISNNSDIKDGDKADVLLIQIDVLIEENNNLEKEV